MPRIPTNQYQDDLEDDFEELDEVENSQSQKLTPTKRRESKDWDEQRREYWRRKNGDI